MGAEFGFVRLLFSAPFALMLEQGSDPEPWPLTAPNLANLNFVQGAPFGSREFTARNCSSMPVMSIMRIATVAVTQSPRIVRKSRCVLPMQASGCGAQFGNARIMCLTILSLIPHVQLLLFTSGMPQDQGGSE